MTYQLTKLSVVKYELSVSVFCNKGSNKTVVVQNFGRKPRAVDVERAKQVFEKKMLVMYEMASMVGYA